MFKIINKQILAKDVKRLDIKAPLIASQIQPGQFVMVIPADAERWIPMAVAEAEPMRGLISFIFQESDACLAKLGAMTIGEDVFSIVGPLGNPVLIEKWGSVVCLASGVGTAKILPICKALKKAGNKVVGIIGAKTRTSLTMEPQMRIACSRLIVTTEDGSYERRGLACEAFKDVIESEMVRRVYAAGSREMVQSLCGVAKSKGIKAWVHLDPEMACGVGLCGSCRVKIRGQHTLACVAGPFFEGDTVDFDHLYRRQSAFQGQVREENQDHPSDEMTKSISKFFPGLLGK